MTFLRGDWFYILLVALDAFFMSRPYLYAIQQDNYRISEIFKSRRLRFVFLFDVIAVVLFMGIYFACYFLGSRAFWGFLSVLFFFISEFAMYFMEDLPTRKKPLRYTKRAVRCMIFVTLFATAVCTVAFGVLNAALENSYIRYVVLFLYPLAYPLLFMMGASVINAFERLNNKRYMRRTARRLDRADLLKIAITGSYGKTSVKNFLNAMLSKKFNVLATPESYNTPMGISKTVNELDETTDIFIAEMGARRVGDIRTLMKMVRPKLSVLTGINNQHLETFKTKENIVKEKLRVLDVEGAIVNSSLKTTIEQANLKRKPRIIYAGFDESADISAKNLSVCEVGSAFDLIIGDKQYPAFTRLIGKNNIEDVLLAAAMAFTVGVEPLLIVQAIEELEPVPHRMELIVGNGIKIIDDSFNSNPDGAERALETLEMFEARKVVLTPGLVELGNEEREENYRLGRKIGEVADLVLLVGVKRTDIIRRGLQDSGYGGEIHIYDKLSSAEEDFKNRLHLGDVLLILNDLPDIYDEKP